MTNEEIVKIMIDKVEDIVRDKVREDFNATRVPDRKVVANNIINELEKVMKDED